jgi:hypothetical protein
MPDLRRVRSGAGGASQRGWHVQQRRVRHHERVLQQRLVMVDQFGPATTGQQRHGLVGGDQERCAQPSQEARKTRRMGGLQRSRISTPSADGDRGSRSHDFASRRESSWRMDRRDEENSPSSGGGHCEGKASLGASLLSSICQMSIGKRAVDRSNRLGGSGTAVPGRSAKVQWPTPEETRSPDVI